MPIKPIQTRYRGYNFRSRLEARWGVFFDALGIKWEYEKEGYDLGDLGWYLPDFYLPDIGVFVEIKPNGVSSDHMSEAHSKCRAFRDKIDNSIVLCCGDPKEYNATLFAFDTCDGGGGASEYDCYIGIFNLFDSTRDEIIKTTDDHNHEWECPPGYYYGIGLMIDDVYSDRVIFATGFASGLKPLTNTYRTIDSYVYVDTPVEKRGDIWKQIVNISKKNITNKCSDKARSARFEHGESGAT